MKFFEKLEDEFLTIDKYIQLNKAEVVDFINKIRLSLINEDINIEENMYVVKNDYGFTLSFNIPKILTKQGKERISILFTLTAVKDDLKTISIPLIDSLNITGKTVLPISDDKYVCHSNYNQDIIEPLQYIFSKFKKVITNCGYIENDCTSIALGGVERSGKQKYSFLYALLFTTA